MTVGQQKAAINVTPMIDVLLVLIIIFMVITPLTPRGLTALVPQESAAERPVESQHAVITVSGDGGVQLNQEPLSLDELDARLRRLFGSAASATIFVRGERGLEFRQVAAVIDIAHGAGIDRVGLMTK
jgi:biopolymer transport protein ExbD